MGDHILGRRARFWLAIADAAEWLWRWSLARANAAVDYGPAEPDVEPARRPF